MKGAMSVDLSLYTYLKNSQRVPIVRLTMRKDETIIRCPFCGDSTKSDQHAHLFIHNEPPYKFFCHLCESSGYGNTLLRRLDLDNPDLILKINSAYEKMSSQYNIKFGGSSILSGSKRSFRLFPEKFSEVELRKIAYFNSRLNVTMSNKDINLFRYILNLEDFLNHNGFKRENLVAKLSDADIAYLNENYAMFLTTSGTDIICRAMTNDLVPKSKFKRYYRLSLTPNLDDISCYTLKNEIDVSKSVHNIYLTEGIWDIIGVYYMRNRQMSDSDVYLASNGKGYLKSLQYITNLGLLNANISIYSDSDVKLADYRRFLQHSLLCKFNNVNIYYNQNYGYKDFGVSKDLINLSPPEILTL